MDLVFASFIASHSCDSDPNMQQIKIYRSNKLEMNKIEKEKKTEKVRKNVKLIIIQLIRELFFSLKIRK